MELTEELKKLLHFEGADLAGIYRLMWKMLCSVCIYAKIFEKWTIRYWFFPKDALLLSCIEV